MINILFTAAYFIFGFIYFTGYNKAFRVMLLS